MNTWDVAALLGYFLLQILANFTGKKVSHAHLRFCFIQSSFQGYVSKPVSGPVCPILHLNGYATTMVADELWGQSSFTILEIIFYKRFSWRSDCNSNYFLLYIIRLYVPCLSLVLIWNIQPPTTVCFPLDYLWKSKKIYFYF